MPLLPLLSSDSRDEEKGARDMLRAGYKNVRVSISPALPRGMLRARVQECVCVHQPAVPRGMLRARVQKCACVHQPCTVILLYKVQEKRCAACLTTTVYIDSLALTPSIAQQTVPCIAQLHAQLLQILINFPTQN
jgi:hypothetical protein